MKRIIRWLRRDKSQPSETDQHDVGVGLEQKTEGEHIDDSSIYLSWPEQADSSVFDTGSLNIEKSEDRNAAAHKPSELEGDSLSAAEEDTGIDPYNTGRFDTKNK